MQRWFNARVEKQEYKHFAKGTSVLAAIDNAKSLRFGAICYIQIIGGDAALDEKPVQWKIYIATYMLVTFRQ